MKVESFLALAIVSLIVYGIGTIIYTIYTICVNNILLFLLALFSLLAYIIFILCKDDDAYLKTIKFQKRKKRFNEMCNSFDSKVEDYCLKWEKFINKYKFNLIKVDLDYKKLQTTNSYEAIQDCSELNKYITDTNYSSPLDYFKNYQQFSSDGNRINTPIPMDENTLLQLCYVGGLVDEIGYFVEEYNDFMEDLIELQEYVSKIFPKGANIDKFLYEIGYTGNKDIDNIDNLFDIYDILDNIPSPLSVSIEYVKLNIFNDKNCNPIILPEKLHEYASWLLKKIEYENKFYSSKEFISLKSNLSKYVQDCNELNKYITELNKTNYLFNSPNDVDVNLNITDSSKYNMSRFEDNELQLQFNVCDCSLSVFNQARRFPIKYFFKYFGIPINERTLDLLDEYYNKIVSIREGCNYLELKKEDIERQLNNTLPSKILEDKDTLYKYIGFIKPIKIKEIKFPIYYFRYISTGGNAKQEISIEFNMETIESFSQYIVNELDKRATVKYQRQLMTPKLRESIKQRDNYTCCKCGISINDEPHLLLEVDHIVPVASGGKTEVNNLQTLCWRCNRNKGKKTQKYI